MESKLFFVQTEEGIEGQGWPTAREALIEYMELSPASDEWIERLIEGNTEVLGIVSYTQEEWDKILKESPEN